MTRNYCQFVINNPLKLLLLVLSLTALAAAWLVVAKPLRLDTNFTSLLPGDIPCVVESERVSRLLGSTDYLIVAVKSPVAGDNQAFIEALFPKIQALPEVTWAAITEDKSFFRERFALYLDTPDLEEIVDRARARVEYEKERANPFFTSLEEEDPPDISMDDILQKYRERLAKQGVKGILRASGEQEADSLASLKPGQKDYFASADGTIYSLMARTARSSADLDFTRGLVEKVNNLIIEADPHRNGEMVAEVVGSFRNRDREFSSIISDIFSSFAFSFALILVVIVAYFRRARAILLVLLPLISGIIWTVALTALILGRLNIVTALIFAVLLGLGIDFGVHMSMRYLEERSRASSLVDSLHRAIARTGRAMLIAGITTAGAMAVLMCSRFKGFSEFGLITVMGILLCLAAYLLMLPPLAVLMERLSVPDNWRLRISPPDATTTIIARPGPKALMFGGTLLAVTLLAAFAAPRLAFEYNFRNLKGADVSTNIHYGKSIGGGTSPVVALLPTAEDARDLSRHLEQIVNNEISAPVPLRRVFSLYSFVPSDQERKIGLLLELRGYIDRGLQLGTIDDLTRKRLVDVRKWTEVQQFGVGDLPDWVLDKFREKDGTLGRMVYLDSGRDDYRVDEIAEFYDHYGAITLPDQRQVHPTSTGFILVEVIRAVQQDGVFMLFGAMTVVFLILLVDFRSIRRAVFVFLPLAVGLLWTAGIMVVFDIKIGLYNMLVLPLLLGVGIDSAVHLYHAYLERGPGSLGYVMKTTGMAIVISSLTTAAGFLGLIVVSHSGLRSIGILAEIGILACLAGTLLTMPLMIMMQEAARSHAGKDI